MENDRERLIEAFASLIAEVPFESISAKMITERAGLPASSFAYEFSDIYAAADAYLEAEVEAVKSADIHPESGGEAFILTASAAFRAASHFPAMEPLPSSSTVTADSCSSMNSFRKMRSKRAMAFQSIRRISSPGIYSR